MKKLYLLFSLIMLIIAISVMLNFDFFKIDRITSDESALSANYKKNNAENLIDSGGFELKNEIIAAINKAEPTIHGQDVKAGIVSHHLPVALPLIAEFYSNLKAARPDIKTFIIIGPDHYERCLYKTATADIDYNTPFGKLPIAKSGHKIFLDGTVKVDNNCFIGEHSIGAQAIFIKYLFPDARIMPIILSSAAGSQVRSGILESIEKIKDVFVIGSLDFSHYQKLTRAEIFDSESEKWIMKNQPNRFNLSHIDSPPAIKLILNYAEDNNFMPIILKRINSFAYTGQTENTTGYMSVFFKQKKL